MNHGSQPQNPIFFLAVFQLRLGLKEQEYSKVLVVFPNRPRARAAIRLPAASVALLLALLVSACGKPPAGPPPRGTPKVTVVTATPADVPVVFEFVAQTQSSRQVNIQARVSGFLDKRVYTEGSIVKAGQVLFQMDQKPFQAQVDARRRSVCSSTRRRWTTSRKSNLARTKPLAEQNALSQKDLDDATGQYQQSAPASLEQRKAQLVQAQLNLSYSTITSPVDGVSSFAAAGRRHLLNHANSQLTTVSVLSPMWVNFSISENEMERIRNQVDKRPARDAAGQQFVRRDRCWSTARCSRSPAGSRSLDPSYNSQTGTFLMRASVDNPQGCCGRTSTCACA